MESVEVLFFIKEGKEESKDLKLKYKGTIPLADSPLLTEGDSSIIEATKNVFHNLRDQILHASLDSKPQVFFIFSNGTTKIHDVEPSGWDGKKMEGDEASKAIFWMETLTHFLQQDLLEMK